MTLLDITLCECAVKSSHYYHSGLRTHCHHKKLDIIVPFIISIAFVMPFLRTIHANVFQRSSVKVIKEIIGDNRCGFRHNLTITDNILCICEILEYSGAVHRLFIDSKKV